MLALKAIGIAIVGCCFTVFHIELAGAALTLRVRLHRYRNALSRDASGLPCDPVGTNECENEFEFCLTRRSSATCRNRIASSGHYEDDDFTFTSSIVSRLGISNPLEFIDVPDEPLRLEITIEDYDPFTFDDLVDIINVNINAPSTLLDEGFTVPRFYTGTFGKSRIELSYQVTNATTPAGTDLPIILGSVIGAVIVLVVAGFVVCICICCCCIFADLLHRMFSH